MIVGRKRLLFVFIGILFLQINGYANILINTEPQDTFPVPVNIKNQLFYLQRTTNTNTVVYALNINAKGVLDESTPVKVFWIRYPEGHAKRAQFYSKSICLWNHFKKE